MTKICVSILIHDALNFFYEKINMKNNFMEFLTANQYMSVD